MTLMTRSPEETRALGASLAKSLIAGDFIALDGELAAGKTCLTQGLAEGLAYRGPVTSPTFTLLHLYEGGRLPLYHFDVFRLKSPEELESLGYEDYFYGDGVCVVEWAGLIAAYLPTSRIGIEMKLKDGFCVSSEARRITLVLHGENEIRRRILFNALKSFSGAITPSG